MTEVPARLSIVTLGVRTWAFSARSTARWAGRSWLAVTTLGPAFSSAAS